MISNTKQNDVGLDCLRTGRVKVAGGSFLSDYGHYWNRAWNPMEAYRDLTGETPQHIIDNDPGGLTNWARGALGTALVAGTGGAALKFAPAVGGLMAAGAPAATAATAAAPTATTAAAPVAATLAAAAKPTAGALALKALKGGLIAHGIGTALDTVSAGANTNIPASERLGYMRDAAINAATDPIRLGLAVGTGGAAAIPRYGTGIASMLYGLGIGGSTLGAINENLDLKHQSNIINADVYNGTRTKEDALQALATLGAPPESIKAYEEQWNQWYPDTPQTGGVQTPDLNLPTQLQTNPNAALLQHHYFNTPKPIQLDLTDATVRKYLPLIYARGKKDIPASVLPFLEQTVVAINAGQTAPTFNLTPMQLQQLNNTITEFTQTPEFKNQWGVVKTTINNLNGQLTQQAQQLQEGFANIDPAAPEYQLDKILPSFVLDEAELTQMQPKLEQMDTLYQKLAAQGLDETQIQQQITSQIPDADNLATRAGLHELASSQLQNMQNGIDSKDQLEAINAIVAGSEAADLSKPGPTNAIKDGFEKATNTSIFSAKGWNEAFEWFSNLEGIEKVAVLGGISLGLAGLITGIFGDNFLLSLIMMTLGAGAVAYGVPEARGQIGEWINQLMPKEEAKK